MNAEQVKNLAKEFGADLVGIAPIDRFEGVSAGNNPLSIFPECRSVIVLGRRILRGSIRGVEEGTSFGSTYGCFGFRWLEDQFLSRTTYDLTCKIEEIGFEAVPLFGYFPEGMPTGRPVAEGKPAPNVIVNTDYAAHAAGLGQIGKGGFFLTPKYGHRQRFATILTDAELDADPIYDGENLCTDCNACVGACPFGAIDTGRMEAAGVGGACQVANINYEICNSCPNGVQHGPGRGSRPDRGAAVCARTCMVRLEKDGKTGNAFENEFRKRKAWRLDSFNRPVEQDITV